MPPAGQRFVPLRHGRNDEPGADGRARALSHRPATTQRHPRTLPRTISALAGDAAMWPDAGHGHPTRAHQHWQVSAAGAQWRLPAGTPGGMIDAGRRAPLKAVRLYPHAITAISTSSAQNFCANSCSTLSGHPFGYRPMLRELSRPVNAEIREPRELADSVEQVSRWRASAGARHGSCKMASA